MRDIRQLYGQRSAEGRALADAAEARLISVSAQLEQADPWTGRIPDIARGEDP